MSIPSTPSKRPKGWIPMPMIATSMISSLPDRPKGVGHDLVAVALHERHDHHLHLHADLQLGEVGLVNAALDLGLLRELDVADGVWLERFGCLHLRVRWRLGDELLRGERPQRSPPVEECLLHGAAAAARTVALCREGHHAATCAPASNETGVLAGPCEEAGSHRNLLLAWHGY